MKSFYQDQPAQSVFNPLNRAWTVNRGLIDFAKSIDPCQPAQFAEADMGRNFSLSLNFLHIDGRLNSNISMPECNTILRAYKMYRYLE